MNKKSRLDDHHYTYINTGNIYDVPQPLSYTLVRVKKRIVDIAHDDDPPTINDAFSLSPELVRERHMVQIMEYNMVNSLIPLKI